MSWIIPLADVEFDSEETLAVQKVLDSRWLTMGAVTQDFERKFCEYSGATYSVAVTNCTAALHLACLAIGLHPGDEVIVPSLTFVATANAVRYTGATPIFADIISNNDLNIDPLSIKKLITDKTKAIIVMHYGSYACKMEEIKEIADEYHLTIIEDAAHSAGAYLHDKMLGTIGDVGCYSFFSNKNMTTGEGGMIVTNDRDIFEKITRLRSHGMTTLTWDRHQGHAWSYDVTDLGYNYRIDEIRAAIGLTQLSKLDNFNEKRRKITVLYRELLLEQCPEVIIPFKNHEGISACHIMPVLLPEGVNRISFMESLKSFGIQTSIHYPPIHKFSYYQENASLSKNNLFRTENVASREVTLPIYPSLNEDQVHYIVNSIKSALLQDNKVNIF
jgi:dTDP-4-amino-4,6-dideoxygalactose transaminase